MAKKKKLKKSAAGRLIELTGLLTRVGTSMIATKTMNAFSSALEKEQKLSKNWSKNAKRVVETLGKMKGGAMKIGQMMSLQEDLLPPEVARILSTLQKSAPPVDFSDMLETIKKDLGNKYNQFDYIDEKSYASASIGQVHRARLKSGEEVVIKIQYPDIDKVVKADLKNFKSLMSLLFSMFVSMDFNIIWKELEARLTEEVNYEKEAENILAMRGFYKDHPDIKIPNVYQNLSGKHVLTMEFLAEMGAEETIKYPQEIRNKWGETLIDLLLSGLFIHRMIHADPNLANFSFCKDGSIIVYDFGCVKKLSKQFMKDYGNMARAVVNDERERIPELLRKLGVEKENGDCLDQSFTDQFLDEVAIFLDRDHPYEFDKNSEFFANIIRVKNQHIKEMLNMKFHRNFVFIDRTLGGHFGNLGKIKPKIDLCEKLINKIDEAKNS